MRWQLDHHNRILRQILLFQIHRGPLLRRLDRKHRKALTRRANTRQTIHRDPKAQLRGLAIDRKDVDSRLIESTEDLDFRAIDVHLGGYRNDCGYGERVARLDCCFGAFGGGGVLVVFSLAGEEGSTLTLKLPMFMSAVMVGVTIKVEVSMCICNAYVIHIILLRSVDVDILILSQVHECIAVCCSVSWQQDIGLRF
jgi:hypothetical protein